MTNTLPALLVASLALVSPALASAQQTQTVVVVEAELLGEPEEMELEEPDPRVVGRVFSELGMGAAAGVVGGMVGGFAGAGIGAESCDEQFFSGCGLVGGLVGHAVAASLLMPLSVAWAASWSDGRGDVWAAYVGELVGLALEGALIGITAAMANDDGFGEMIGVSMVGALVFPLIGAVVGYELSDDANRAAGSTRARAETAPQIIPTAAFDANGGTIGIAGSF